MNSNTLWKPFYKYAFLSKKQKLQFISTLKNNFHHLVQAKSIDKSKYNCFFKLKKSEVKKDVRTITSHTHTDAVNSLLNYLCTRDQSDAAVTIIDMTYGDGYHTKLILENIENVKLLCLDRDKESFKKAQTLGASDPRIIPVHGKFSDLPLVLSSMEYKFNSIDAIILDVGVSDSQTNSARGFTPNSNAILDMRMDEEGIAAHQVLSAIEEVSLAKVLKIYGEEKHSKQIARSIIETRYTLRKLERTCDLNELIAPVLGADVRIDAHRNTSEHVAQKVYNGLRRFVNNELNELNYAMIIAEKYLKQHGIVVTKCNSIVEDKIVKRHLTGNVVENCANDLSLKFVNHNLTMNTKDLSHLTYSPWSILSKNIASDSDLKLRVAMKK